MCGIHVAISRNTGTGAIPTFLNESLRNRGPDHFGQITTHLQSGISVDDASILTFTSTVLSLRGDHVTKQPFQDPQTSSVLCWNGEAWKIDGRAVEGNDGEAVFALLSDASLSATANSDAILQALRSIEGPFAFVYFDSPSRTLYFGRDRLGRRSLLISHDDAEGSLAISSVAETCQEKWREVEADGIYSLALAGRSVSLPYLAASRHDWLPGSDSGFVSSIGKFNTALPAGNSALLASSQAVVSLREQLIASLSLRVRNIPQPHYGSTSNTRIAVLFSGGLDCTVLARLSHDLLPLDQAVDLLNVAFENPRVAAQLQKHATDAAVDVYEACPDRITGRKAFAELQRVCPERAFRFIAINIPYTETCAHRARVISLMYPHNTEMDLSIAYALYFAARGQGLCCEGDNTQLPATVYTTPARVLLSGLGADELFGGYVRHPSAFNKAGYPGLIDELKLDVGRLGKRNLGRDDRVMAHWGKEVRFPFLDERLVRWAIETPAWEKCDFDNGEEISGVEAGKRVLRLVALELGMDQVAREKKRAIQFGSRTAKMESGRVKGTKLIS